jgi:7-cyano-7-deazaguanine synthase in queuosine biosynthesis
MQYRIVAGDPTDLKLPNAADIACRLGHDVDIDLSDLCAFSSRSLFPSEKDLLTVASVVMFADRAVKRKRSFGWARNLHLCIPVYEPDRWSADEVTSALCEALAFATGDRWTFDFVFRHGTESDSVQRRIRKSFDSPPIIMPYSGGLDSFAALKLQSAQGFRDFVLVTAIHNSASVKQLKATAGSRELFENSVRMPVKRRGMRHSEESFRTRTFLFFTTAALVCRITGGLRVVIPENGEGSIGASLVPIGGEYPYQAIHPGFTKRLEKFLVSLWHQPIEFEHPYLWLTKAQLIERLGKLGGTEGWSNTRSCSRNVRRYKKASASVQCGVCGGCLLRRIALVAGGFGNFHEAESYLWHDLNQPTLDASLNENCSLIRYSSENDRQIAEAAVLSHRHLAAMANGDPTEPEKLRCLYQLSKVFGSQCHDLGEKLDTFLERHTADWELFLEQLKPTSWVRKLAGAA